MIDEIKVIADIISNVASIPADRVVIYSGDWIAPKDKDVYVILSIENIKRSSKTIKRDFETLQNTISGTFFGMLNVDIVSKDDTAIEQKETIALALSSDYAVEKMETNNIRIWENGTISDLSAIEGSGSLKRFRLTFIISYTKELTENLNYYKYIKTEEINDVDNIEP